jgi:hypothetical protein
VRPASPGLVFVRVIRRPPTGGWNRRPVTVYTAPGAPRWYSPRLPGRTTHSPGDFLRYANELSIGNGMTNYTPSTKLCRCTSGFTVSTPSPIVSHL